MQLNPKLTSRFNFWMRVIPWVVTLVAGVVPLWMPQRLPIVDMPQHLHLISVLHRLTDQATLYPEYFQLREAFTSYLGYYYSVDALSFFMPLETANRVFLSLYVISLPFSVAFLLRTFHRPTWPALLTIPFAYGDSLAWGFVNSSVSFTLAIFTAACFIRTIEDAKRRWRWGVATAILLVLVLVFHAQPFGFLAFALPILLFTSSAPDGWRAKQVAVLSVLPGVSLFLYWFLTRVAHPVKYLPPELWNRPEYYSYPVGPMFSTNNLVFKTFYENGSGLIFLPKVGLSLPRFPLLGSFFNSPDESRALLVVFLLAFAATAVGLLRREESSRGGYRLLGLAVLSTAFYFILPTHIRGYMQFINVRYATYIAVFLMAAIPIVPTFLGAFAPWLVMASTLLFAVPMASAFRAFDNEWQHVIAMAEAAPPRVKVMGLLYNLYSTRSPRPIYLHAAAEVAREQGGIPNYSFALTEHSPLQYRRDPPPTYPNEWLPHSMKWETEGMYYDCFVLRGAPPRYVFGSHLNRDVVLRKASGSLSLYCRP